MPFTIRPYRRLPVCCPVTYHAGLSLEGQGTAWNVSLDGWRLSGDLPLLTGEDKKRGQATFLTASRAAHASSTSIPIPALPRFLPATPLPQMAADDSHRCGAS